MLLLEWRLLSVTAKIVIAAVAFRIINIQAVVDIIDFAERVQHIARSFIGNLT